MANTQAEDKPAGQATHAVDEVDDSNTGYKLDPTLYQRGDIKLAADGHTVLIPQPSDSPDDPLNWPPLKKMTIVIVMSTIAFLPEFGSAMGIPALIPQSM